MDTRHGDGSHFMRPDRVYRTSVLSPMVGYQPWRDVNEVAMSFTQGPERGMALSGLGAMPGPFQRFILRIKALIAQRKAEQFMQVGVPMAIESSPPVVMKPLPVVHPPKMPPQVLQGLGMPGPEAIMGNQIAPYLATQMTGAMALMQGRYGAGYPSAAADALARRPLRWWY